MKILSKENLTAIVAGVSTEKVMVDYIGNGMAKGLGKKVHMLPQKNLDKNKNFEIGDGES